VVSTSLQVALLIVCWLTGLVTLVIFLESWFALTRRGRLPALSPGSDLGLVTVIVPLRSDAAAARRTIESVLSQTYPFIELVLVYSEIEPGQASLVREFCARRTHLGIRPHRVPFRLTRFPERIRAMELASAAIRGDWILVVDPDLVLEPHAVGSALQFAADKEITALGLTPGVECRSMVQKLVAPSLEWLVRMMRVLDRGREQLNQAYPPAGFMLFHRDTHAVVNQMNRMPGILNEAGWTLWSYRVEGLRTFHGDGSGWIFRDATPAALLSGLRPAGPVPDRRTPVFLFGSLAIAVTSLFGMIFGFLAPDAGMVANGILYLSAFSYSLMATSYFFYSRRLRAATWFAPFWFLTHCWALFLVVAELGRSRSPDADVQVLAGHGSDSEVPTRH
jgi:Glycosyl transferase family 2